MVAVGLLERVWLWVVLPCGLRGTRPSLGMDGDVEGRAEQVLDQPSDA